MATLDLGKIKQVWRGTYNNGTAYVVDDLVAYTDSGITSTYICVANSTGNAPSSSGTAHASWNYVAKGVVDPIPSQSGQSGKFLTTNGSASSWGAVSSDSKFTHFRVNTGWSGAANPVVNWDKLDNIGDLITESSGNFSFGQTGYYYVMFHVYCYLNSDQDNIELRINFTTNNSSYAARSLSYGHMNNDDGGNLYTMIRASTVLDITDTTNMKVRFRTANAGANFQASASLDECYAYFQRLGDT